MNNSPFNSRVVATGVQGVSKSTGGKTTVCNVPVKHSIPCTVILVHGINDMDEVYQNQEQGTIADLNERMGHTGMYPHERQQYRTDMGDSEQQNVKMPGRSSMVPSYWGYELADHATYIEDQRYYREEQAESGDAIKLPYDAYQEDDHVKLEKLRHIP